MFLKLIISGLASLHSQILTSLVSETSKTRYIFKCIYQELELY